MNSLLPTVAGVLALACSTAFAAPKPVPKAAPKPPVKAAPAPPVDAGPPVVSMGKETVLVDHLPPERPTIVLFYQPAKAEDTDLLELVQDRLKKDSRVALRLVRLSAPDAPIAAQYEVTATPVAFVYDRNKNLLGRGARIDELGPLVGKALRTARIKWVDEQDASAPEVYRQFGGGRRPVPEIMKTMSLQPEIMERIGELAGRYHFQDGYLNRRTKEMIAAYVSALNRCKY
jgi:hypothetical protein